MHHKQGNCTCVSHGLCTLAVALPALSALSPKSVAVTYLTGWLNEIIVDAWATLLHEPIPISKISCVSVTHAGMDFAW
jgi:hypothetical protein